MNDHHVSVRYWKDQRREPSSWASASIGDVGEYDARPLFRQFGVGREFYVEISVSSPRKSDLFGAAASIEVLGS